MFTTVLLCRKFAALFILEAHKVVTIDKLEKHDSSVITLLSCKVEIVLNIIETKTWPFSINC